MYQPVPIAIREDNIPLSTLRYGLHRTDVYRNYKENSWKE